MGREAAGEAEYLGQTGAVKALLESDVLILRGALRARIPRGDLAGWRADGAELHLAAGGVPLTLRLGEAEAAAWVRALDRPVPTLAGKLGLAPGLAVHLMGPAPPALREAMAGVVEVQVAEAALILAVLDGPEALAAALALVRGCPIWTLHRKGPAADPGESAVRAAFRGIGWRDTKSCAVDAEWSATRYHPPKPG